MIWILGKCYSPTNFETNFFIFWMHRFLIRGIPAACNLLRCACILYFAYSVGEAPIWIKDTIPKTRNLTSAFNVCFVSSGNRMKIEDKTFSYAKFILYSADHNINFVHKWAAGAY